MLKCILQSVILRVAIVCFVCLEWKRHKYPITGHITKLYLCEYSHYHTTLVPVPHYEKWGLTFEWCDFIFIVFATASDAAHYRHRMNPTKLRLGWILAKGLTMYPVWSVWGYILIYFFHIIAGCPRRPQRFFCFRHQGPHICSVW